MEAVRRDKGYGVGDAYALLSTIIPHDDTAEADAAVLLLAWALADLNAIAKRG